MVRAAANTANPHASLCQSWHRLCHACPPLPCRSICGLHAKGRPRMKTLLPILAALSLGACAAMSGRPIDGAKVQNIQQCTTTEQEVISWFGSPGRRGKSGAYRSLAWRYSGSDEYGKINQELIVFVNASNRVVSYAWNPASPQVEVIDNCQR
jgi:hypothetical protein